MNTAPSENVVLSSAQLNQINTVERKLTNLSNEVTIGKKELLATSNDLERITKEKEYQQELLTIVSAQLVEAQSVVDKLNESKLVLSDELAKLSSDIAAKTSVHTAKETELKDREDAVAEREQQSSNRHDAWAKAEILHGNETEEFNEKVAKLQAVLKEF